MSRAFSSFEYCVMIFDAAAKMSSPFTSVYVAGGKGSETSSPAKQNMHANFFLEAKHFRSVLVLFSLSSGEFHVGDSVKLIFTIPPDSRSYFFRNKKKKEKRSVYRNGR